MTLINIDDLIASLQRVKALHGANAQAAILSCNPLGNDRYGVGYGIVAGKNSDLLQIKSALDNPKASISNDVFSKLQVLAKDYEFCGCLY